MGTWLSAVPFSDAVVYCSGCAELWVGGECGILPDGLVAPPAPWPGSVSGPHWLAAAPRTPSLLSQACPGVVLSPPPIWHIAGLSPRACERRVGEYRRGGNMSSRGEMRSFWIWARFWFQPPFQSQLSSVYHKKRCMGRIVEFCKHVPKFIRIQTLDSMMMWERLRQTVRRM